MLIHADKTTFGDYIKDFAIADFFTTDCPICEKLSPVFEEVAQSQSDINFLKVNLDEDITLAERYSITHVPTIMLFRNSELVVSKSGYMDNSELMAFINREEAQNQ